MFNGWLVFCQRVYFVADYLFGWLLVWLVGFTGLLGLPANFVKVAQAFFQSRIQPLATRQAWIAMQSGS